MEHPVNEAKPQQRQPCRRRVLRHRLQQAAEFQFSERCQTALCISTCGHARHSQMPPMMLTASNSASGHSAFQRENRARGVKLLTCQGHLLGKIAAQRHILRRRIRFIQRLGV